MRLLAPVTSLNAQAVECSTAKAAPTETAQDTKPAVQLHATGTLDETEIQKAGTAIQRLHQVTLVTHRQKVEITFVNQRLLKQSWKTLPA